MFLRCAFSLLLLAFAACSRMGPSAQTGPAVSTRSDAARPASAVSIKVIGLNDFHGQLTNPGTATRVPHPSSESGSLDLPTGGVAHLAGLVSQLKSQNPLNVVVAAGDLIGASPLNSGLFHDEPAIEALNEVGLEFSAVGNHEFDDGMSELQRMQKGGCATDAPEKSCHEHMFPGARFQYLAANVVDSTTGRPVFPAYAVKTFDLDAGRKLKIGFIGAVTKGVPNLVVPDAIRNLKFNDEATSINATVPELRAQGVDVIVVLIHEGGVTSAKAFDDTTCPNFKGGIIPILDRLDPAIDVVVSGHTHQTYICRRNGKLVTSAGSQGRYVTDIELSVDPRTRHVIESTARQVAVVNDLAPNPAPQRYPTVSKSERTQLIVDTYSKAAAPLTERTIARISEDITRETTPAGESALGDLIADAHLAATSAAANGGAQIAFMNKPGVRSDLLARTGRITYGEIHAVHPFENALVTMTLTGAQLRELLEQQWTGGSSLLQVSGGFSYAWLAAGLPGAKVDAASIRLNGKPVDADGRYRVTVNEFLAGGGDGFKVLASGTDRVRGMIDLEALEKYLASKSMVSAPKADRIRKK